MRAQAKAQDALPGVEVERHAMWTKPDTGLGLQPHIFALRTEIARKLVPFDGKPGSQSDAVTDFCRWTYAMSTLAPASVNPLWLLGRMAIIYNSADKNFPAIPRLYADLIAVVIANSNLS